MKYAAIGPISIHLPERIETNAELSADNERWDMDLIASKTGIHNRHIAAEGECSSDLGVKAAEKLFAEFNIDPKSIDFLLFCTQSPDYPLPTTACLIQDRLGLPTSAGALDFNLGCSGFVYGLSMADGLIQSGAAKRILFITAETYSKFIDQHDRSLRTIFGDGAAATLIEAADKPTLSGFKFGTDGSGADTLLVAKGGHRAEEDRIGPRKRKRWKSDLYMDGPALMKFTSGQIPGLVDSVLETKALKKQDIGFFLFHQATFKMLDLLIKAMELPEGQMPMRMKDVGNTVSSTLPILIHQLRQEKALKKDQTHLLVGFGVGWSWAGCLWKDTHGS